MDEQAELTRRTLVKLLGGAAIAGGAAALGIRYASEPAVATSGLSAEDVTASAPEGRLQRLTLAQTVTVKWEHLRPVKTVCVRFRANGPQSNGTAIDWTSKQRDSAVSTGSVSFDLDEAGMLGKNGGPLDASSFRATEEGATVEKQVEVSMDLALVDADDNTVRKLTPAAKTTYNVTITNEKGQVTVSGQVNTGAKCLQVNDFPVSLLNDAECELRDSS